jgi:hypothetical protein
MSYYQSSGPSNDGSFARSGAKFAVLAPVIVILLNAAIRAPTNSADGMVSKVAAMIGGLASIVLLCGGFVCAVVALCSVGRCGREGLLRRGITGLVLNGSFLAILGLVAVQGFSEGRARAVKARESRQDVRAAVDDMRESLRQNFDPEMGVTNVDLAKARAIRTSVDEAAAHAKGDDAKILKATSAYLEQVEMAGRNLNGALAVMQAGNVLEFKNAPSEEDFARRRRLVRNYQAASEKSRLVTTNAPAFFRAELQRLGVASAEIEKAVTGFQKKSGAQFQLLNEVRDTDARMTAAMLQVFDLLENNPRDWKGRSDGVMFVNTATLNTYNGLIEEIQNAASDQIKAQRKLVSLK